MIFAKELTSFHIMSTRMKRPVSWRKSSGM
jgi:hypothetical protein